MRKSILIYIRVVQKNALRLLVPVVKHPIWMYTPSIFTTVLMSIFLDYSIYVEYITSLTFGEQS